MLLAWILCGVLSVITIILCVKIHMLKRSAEEICAEFTEHLKADTNTLISVSSGDRHIKRLAAELNRQLRLLRDQRRQYLNGDRELKEAVTNISHDLRTPLTAICGYLDLLEKEEKSEDAARYLAFIENRTEALKQLTEELFRYSLAASGQELELQPVDLGRALEEVLLSFYGAMESRGIIPELRLTEQKAERLLDPTALNRVLGNILSNALRYSAGDLTVTLDEEGKMTFSNQAPELDPIAAGRLFDRFYTVEAARNSTGLGLSIAKALTERMGGSIRAEYDAGRLTLTVQFFP